MSSNNYVKSKLLQLEAFCIIVENDSNAAEASRKTGKSSQALNNALLSLEDELKYQLFDRKGNHLTLNLEGEKYYPIAKKTINQIKIASSKQIDEPIHIKAPNKTILYIKDFCVKYLSWRLIKKIKYKLCFMIVVCTLYTCIGNYLTKINYWFDRDLYDNASPKLKTIMTDGSYMISEEIACSFEITQLNLDMYKIVKKLSAKYKNIPIIMYSMADSPVISMRLTGDEKIDKVFKEREFSYCNTQKSYNAAQKHYSDSIELFGINKNFRIYNIYKNLDGCVHYKYFEENTKKYPKNIFGKLASKKETLMEPSRGWIIKYGDYYYLLSMNNLVLTEHVDSKNIDAKQRRYIIYKKMTTEEFRNYTYGSYWKMISEYNILFN